MCYLLGISSLQVLGMYMTSLSEEFEASTAVLGLLCGLALSVTLVLGNHCNFLLLIIKCVHES